MKANDTNGKIVYPELSYQVTGLCFSVHNELGRYQRERQYADALETLLKGNNLSFQRERPLPVALIDNQFTNRADFAIEGRILLDVNAKPVVTKEDYYQMNRYLVAAGFKLSMIVNFRNKYLKPIRVIRANS